MVILNKKYKLKASSLTEVLVATVLILLVFGIATVTLNNVLQSTMKNQQHTIENELTKLMYEYKHQQLKVPSQYEEGNWQFRVAKNNEDTINGILFEAKNVSSKKTITKKCVANEN